MQFLNRADAGRKLAEKLVHYAGRDDVIVLALPRGGVPVGYEVARRFVRCVRESMCFATHQPIAGANFRIRTKLNAAAASSWGFSVRKRVHLRTIAAKP